MTSSSELVSTEKNVHSQDVEVLWILIVDKWDSYEMRYLRLHNVVKFTEVVACRLGRAGLGEEENELHMYKFV